MLYIWWFHAQRRLTPLDCLLKNIRNDKTRAEQYAQKAEAIRQRNKFLYSFSAKLIGLLPMFYYPWSMMRIYGGGQLVILATVPITMAILIYRDFPITSWPSMVGVSLNSVSHWAICVVNRGFGTCCVTTSWVTSYLSTCRERVISVYRRRGIIWCQATAST